MESNRQKLLNSVSNTLTEIYEEYSAQGMLAVYLWGSILTQDFNPETSDIDTIAIVDDNFATELKEKIHQQLVQKHPEIKKLDFHLLYKSELDTGVTKGTLARVVGSAALLLDLPTWYWVQGVRFSQKDFDLPVLTIKEAIKLRREICLERWPNIESIQPDAVQYFVKHIMRIVHLEQLERKNIPYDLLSYTDLKNGSQGMPEEEIVSICFNLKAKQWDFEEFKKYQTVLFNYVSQ